MRRKNPIADTLERLELRLNAMLNDSQLTESSLDEIRQILAVTRRMIDLARPEAHDELLSLSNEYFEISLRLFQNFKDTIRRVDSQNSDLMTEVARLTSLLAESRLTTESATRDAQVLDHLIFKEGEGGIIQQIGALVIEAVAKLDALLTNAFAFESEDLAISADATEILSTIIEARAALDKQVAELSSRTAPLIAKKDRLERGDLDTLGKLIPRVVEVRIESDRIYGQLDELRSRCERVAAQIKDWEAKWLELKRMTDAMEILFPLISESNIYVFANTNAEVVSRKRARCSELLPRIKSGLRQAQRIIAQKVDSVRASRDQVHNRLTELERIRTLLNVPEYDALDTDARRTVQMIVLSFGDTGLVSLRRIHDLLVTTCDTAAIDEDTLTAFIVLPYFASRGDPRFKLYSLTELGFYWQERWQRELPELIASVSDGWKRVREIENQREEGAKRAKETRAAKLADAKSRRETEEREKETRSKLREAELHDEVRIKEKICRDGLDEIMGLIYLLRDRLPGPRDSSQWAKMLTAAWSSGLIRTRRILTVSRGLARLFTHKPPLFELKKTDGKFVINKIGINVCLLLQTIPQRDVEQFMQMVSIERRWWTDRQKGVYNQFFANYHAAREAVPPTCIE